MRYFIVKYRQVMARKGPKLEPQTDEVIAVSSKVKLSDQQTAAVILDFKERRVLQASLDGKTIPRDWDNIRGFYHQHYAQVIDDLEALHGYKVSDITPSKSDTDPVSN